MKETGLMFKAPLVRAILEGRKTQTRRIVKWKDLQKGLNLGFSGLRADKIGNNWVLESNTPTSREWRCTPTPCPLGQPGNRIYVRETWNWFDPQSIPTERIGCRAPFTGIANGVREIPWVAAYAADGSLPYPGYDGKDHWRPSIHMPKWAARIWLEITGVRVERLQQITSKDCIAEGISTTIDRECELKAADESKSVVRYNRHSLDIDEVKQHVEHGKLPTKLALTWDDRVSFLLNDNLQIKKVAFTDTVLDQAGDEGGFDTDVAIATGELAKLIPDLIEALDGEGRMEIGQPTTDASTLAVRVSKAGTVTGPASAPQDTDTQAAPF